MERLNYYNYFTEIEEHFAKRRNKHLVISPLDWSLIETWKDAGIPLHVAIRGIDRIFDAYDARPKKTKIINSIFYCHQEVLLAFEEFKHANIGSTPETQPGDREMSRSERDSNSEGDRARVLEFLNSRLGELGQVLVVAKNQHRDNFAETLSRALNRLGELKSELEASQPRFEYETLERDLAAIDHLIIDSLMKELSEEQLKDWHSEAKKELKHYRKNLSKDTYEKILQNYIYKKMRQQFNLLPLSLFYA